MWLRTLHQSSWLMQTCHFFNQLYERLVDHGMSLLYELLGFFSDERQNPLDGLKEENSKMIQGCFLLGIFGDSLLILSGHSSKFILAKLCREFWQNERTDHHALRHTIWNAFHEQFFTSSTYTNNVWLIHFQVMESIFIFSIQDSS